uniref:C-type lectin domain-containing protein n=1 Tax=Glossina palpalis gambiensis TaxID=67801 RepID=A0A1B0C5L2_9MUSC
MKAFILAASILLLSFVNVSWAQFNNGRVLDPPNPQLCAQRIIHERTPDGKGYFFSWRDPALKGVEEDWLTARNYCRRRCMDSVSLETSLENEWIKQRVVNENVSSLTLHIFLTQHLSMDCLTVISLSSESPMKSICTECRVRMSVYTSTFVL